MHRFSPGDIGLAPRLVRFWLCWTKRNIILTVHNAVTVIFSVFLSRKNNKAPWVDDIGYPLSRPFLASFQGFYWSVLKLVKYLQRFDWSSVQYVVVVAPTVHMKKFFKTALVWVFLILVVIAGNFRFAFWEFHVVLCSFYSQVSTGNFTCTKSAFKCYFLKSPFYITNPKCPYRSRTQVTNYNMCLEDVLWALIVFSEIPVLIILYYSKLFLYSYTVPFKTKLQRASNGK